jgi:hypothetical protein
MPRAILRLDMVGREHTEYMMKFGFRRSAAIPSPPPRIAGEVTESSCESIDEKISFSRLGVGCTPCAECMVCLGGNADPLQAPRYWAEVIDQTRQLGLLVRERHLDVLYPVAEMVDKINGQQLLLGTCAQIFANHYVPDELALG